MPPNDATGTLYYLHQDHLGSTSLVTCGNSACGTVGSVVARQWYYPYGAVRGSVGTLPTKRTYTGQLTDETGLYFYNARYYSPLIGRFVSADTDVPASQGGPQALNRYAFVLNNPLKYTDPSGHWPEWFDYGLGVGYQFVNDMAFGIPNAVLGTGWQDEQSYAFQSGQRLGRDVSVALNVALAVDGTVKLAAGIAAMGPTAGGGALCGAATGGVCLIPAGGALAAEAGLAGVGAVEGLVGGANLITIKNNPLQGPRYTASNFRKNLENRTPIPKGMKNPEAHHMLPQALEARFNKLGINIHDPRWGAWWAKADHAKYWYRYNWDWERWFADFARRSATPTLQEVEQQAAFMARQYGLTWP
jgi:RHS repeat-associated protein